jgi:hypothetical protein
MMKRSILKENRTIQRASKDKYKKLKNSKEK